MQEREPGLKRDLNIPSLAELAHRAQEIFNSSDDYGVQEDPDFELVRRLVDDEGIDLFCLIASIARESRAKALDIPSINGEGCPGEDEDLATFMRYLAADIICAERREITV